MALQSGGTVHGRMLPDLTLATYKPGIVDFDCPRCVGRHVTVEVNKLRRRYGEQMSLAEIALCLARDSKTPCPMAISGNCGVRAIEPGVHEWATLYNALHGQWRLTLQCDRHYAALKKTKPCPGPIELDVRSLIVLHGMDTALVELFKRAICPGCGSEHVHIHWTVPPPAPPPPDPVTRLPDGRPVGLRGEDEAAPRPDARRLRVVGGTKR